MGGGWAERCTEPELIKPFRGTHKKVCVVAGSGWDFGASGGGKDRGEGGVDSTWGWDGVWVSRASRWWKEERVRRKSG